MNSGDFDKIFQDSFKSFEPTPPKGVWNGIENNIKADPSKINAPDPTVGMKFLTPIIKNVILGISAVAVVGTVVYFSAIKRNDDNLSLAKKGNIELVDDTKQAGAEEGALDEVITTPEADVNTEKEGNETEKSGVVLINKKETAKGQYATGASTKKVEDSKEANQQNDGKPINPAETSKEESHSLIAPIVLSDTFICPGIAMEFYWPNATKARLIIGEINVAAISGRGVLNYQFKEPGVYNVTWEYGDKRSTIRKVKVYNAFARFSCLPLGEGRYQFGNQCAGMHLYRWDFGDGKGQSREFEPVYQYRNSAVQMLKIVLDAESPQGCKDRYIIEIKNSWTIKVQKPTIPNVFTPGSTDGLNDRFIVKIDEETEYHLLITDIGGKLVFESFNKQNSWDGTDFKSGEQCGSGNYMVTLRYRQLDMEPVTERVRLKLIRN